MKTITVSFVYSGDAETWDEIRRDAENEQIKNVFIGNKDFVNVVRCKDCKNWDKDDYCGTCYGIRIMRTRPDWFCADGERRAE